MTSLWPDRNFVADSTTRSAPSSSGRHTYGEANVLSTMYVAPCSWARRASAAWSVTTVVGLAIVSAYTTRVGASAMAAAAAAVSVRSAKSTRTPNRTNVSTSWVRVEP